MNENDIKKILEELYAVDGGLRSRERELIVMIKVLAVKPRADYDPEFVKDLRARLLVELSRMRGNKITVNMILMKNMRYMLAGLAVLVVAGIAVFQFALPKRQSTGVNALLSINITKVGDRAFGSLSALSATGGSTEKTSATVAPTSAQNAAAPSAAVGSAPRAAALGMGGAGTASGGTAGGATVAPMPIRPDLYIQPSPITYVYKGDTFTQDKAKVDVLKQVMGDFSAGNLAAALGQSGLGLVDISSFQGSDVSNITFIQNQSFGYMVNVDFTTGAISISSNWQEWPQNNGSALNATDIPATSTVINIASQFLADHHIPMGNYGNPEVTNNSYFAVPLVGGSVGSAGSAPAATKETMIPYYSDAMQIMYPLMVNGRNVYAEGGSKIGLSVEVNVRYKKVSNVYGLNVLNYQASAYDAITDVNKIISIAENPSFYPIMYGGVESVTTDGSSGTQPAKNTQEVDLGTPRDAYVQMYQYDNATGIGSQFLVPALAFRVTSTPDASMYYYPIRTVIVVPLAQDFLQDNNPVRIMNGVVPPPVPPTPVGAPAVK